MFPLELVQRLLEIYTKQGDVILDPFMGSGSTLVAAHVLNRQSIGFEITPEFINLTKQRLANNISEQTGSFQSQIYAEDARQITRHIAPNSIDLIITSPPYWDIHRQRRTADGKHPRPYSNSSQDLGNKKTYEGFLAALETIFDQLFLVLKPGNWCILVVMDLRKRNRFYPFHINCITKMEKTGFELEDIIIWDRHHEYNNLRPLGYPTTFRVNKVHEYILIFQKPP